MKSKKTKLLVISAITLGVLTLGGALGFGIVNAEGTDNYPSIVKKIAEKFNLNTNEVNKVFKENRQERQAECQSKLEEKLNKAVEEGKITEEQKKAILDKHNEMKEKREELKNLSPEERKEAMKGLREEMKKWAEENNIDLKQFFMQKAKGRKGNGLGPASND